jgi:hypothetical protein
MAAISPAQDLKVRMRNFVRVEQTRVDEKLLRTGLEQFGEHDHCADEQH